MDKRKLLVLILVLLFCVALLLACRILDGRRFVPDETRIRETEEATSEPTEVTETTMVTQPSETTQATEETEPETTAAPTTPTRKPISSGGSYTPPPQPVTPVPTTPPPTQAPTAPQPDPGGDDWGLGEF